MKKSNKYNYIDGKQITDPDTGKRVYEISSYRLPSVTTVLGATKNTDFLKKWKAKVGEENAERIKNVSSARGTSMHKFLESFMSRALVTMILQNSDARRRCPWPTKLWRLVLRQWIGVLRVGSYVTLSGPLRRAKQTLYANHNDLETVVDFKQANRPKKKGMDRRLLFTNRSVSHGTRLRLRLPN